MEVKVTSPFHNFLPSKEGSRFPRLCCIFQRGRICRMRFLKETNLFLHWRVAKIGTDHVISIYCQDRTSKIYHLDIPVTGCKLRHGRLNSRDKLNSRPHKKKMNTILGITSFAFSYGLPFHWSSHHLGKMASDSTNGVPLKERMKKVEEELTKMKNLDL